MELPEVLNESKVFLKGNIVITQFLLDGIWYEYIPWDDI